MKLAQKLINVVNEMGRSPTEMKDQFKAYKDELEKHIFLFLFAHDSHNETRNHWLVEINGFTSSLFKKNKKGNNNRKNWSKDKVVNEIVLLFEPFALNKEATVAELEDEGYKIKEEQDFNQVVKLANIIADHVTSDKYRRLTLEEIDNVIK